MKLKFGKKYNVRINKEGIYFCSLKEIAKVFKNRQILVCYERVGWEGYFKIIDKRLKHYDCFHRHYYLNRFIIGPQQLELDF